MSIRIMSWVWEHSPAAGNELLLLLAIADYADDDGIAFPSIQTLTTKTRMSKSTVIRTTKNCVTANWLKVEKRGRGRVNNQYQLLIDPTLGVGLTRQLSQDDTLKGSGCTCGQSQPDTSDVSDCDPSGVTGDTADVSLMEHRTIIEPSSNSDMRARHGAAAEEKKPKRKTGTRIPEDFKVTDSMREWFREKGLGQCISGRAETEKFRNYWAAKTGAGATKLDWAATWRVWMINAAQRAGWS